jgi:glyoxylase-like metal-dependent hydrolase (beta-lactamase superfamily II)
MNVTIFSLGPLSTNGYLLDNGKEAVFIDPGGKPEDVLQKLEQDGLTLTHVLNTHLHFDHVYGNTALHKATGAVIMANPKDEFLLGTEVGGGGFMGFPEVDKFEYTHLEEGEARFMDELCNVLATPGHTPGSLSFHFPESKVVFVGDLLFERSIGRTDFPGGSMDELKDAVRSKIFTLPPETVVHSGHGSPTSVGDEALHNPYFQG